MKRLGRCLLMLLVCVIVPAASCRGQLPSSKARGGVGKTFEVFSDRFIGREVKGWAGQNVDDKQCIVSEVIEFPSGDEINHHAITVTYSGKGTVAVSIAHSTSNDLKTALAKSYLHSPLKTVKSREKTAIVSSYKGERFAWIILRVTGKAKILSVAYSCLWGKGTLFGHVGKHFEFGGGKLPYRLMMPKNYNPRKSYPLIITVAGSGGIGSDNRKSLELVGLARQLFIKYYNDKKYECISIVTQVPDPKTIPPGWFPKGIKGAPDRIYHPYFPSVNENSWYTQATLELIKSLEKDLTCNIDSDRIYFTGFSLGGKACWEFLKAGREVFAGALCCGGWPIGRPYSAPNQTQLTRLKLEAQRYKHIPVQIFAGEKDKMNLPSKILHKILLDQGSKSTYTEFPGASHVSSANMVWTNAKYIDWLLQQNRRKNPKPAKDPFPNGKYD